MVIHKLYCCDGDGGIFISVKSQINIVNLINAVKRDLMYIVNRDNKIWWYARVKDADQEGYIPVNCVISLRVSKPVPQVLDHPKYMGRYDFSSEDDRYLSFKKGDLMYALDTIEGDWWFAKSKHTGQEGYMFLTIMS